MISVYWQPLNMLADQLLSFQFSIFTSFMNFIPFQAYYQILNVYQYDSYTMIIMYTPYVLAL
jgi:hypothetical protein